MDSRGLYVGQLPLSASDAKLRELFEPYGPVKTIINNVLKGYAFLYFTNPRHVDAAMAEPAHYMDGQRLRVESKSTRDYRDQKKQEEAEEADRERARKRRDGYDAGEAGLQSLQEQRRRAAEEKRREFDARHRERLVEMERQESAEADAGEADEMPVIKKRTPPKGAAGDGRGGGGGRGGLLRFAFAESSEGESVSVEGAGGVARYVVQGKTKGPFTEVCFDEDDDGPFVDFEEVGSSLGVTPELVPRLAEYFDSIQIHHNFQGGSGGGGGGGGSSTPAAAAAAAAATPISKGVQGASGGGGQQPKKPVGVAGHGRGRGRGT